MALLRLLAAAGLWVAGGGPVHGAGSAVAPPQDPPEVDERLTHMRLALTEEPPYRFVLAYHGPLMPFRGLLCYHFAGYGETCLDPGIRWLTPATTIPLHAPGGVPRDLLEGYVMLVCFPALSERTFRYALPRGASGDGGPR